MSAYPNKPTLVAAALYGISAQAETKVRAGVIATTWCDLSPEQKKPFIEAAEYLAGQIFGVAPQAVDRVVLAKSIAAKKLAVQGDPELIASVFLNIASVLPG